jgi:hypothetical protein
MLQAQSLLCTELKDLLRSGRERNLSARVSASGEIKGKSSSGRDVQTNPCQKARSPVMFRLGCKREEDVFGSDVVVAGIRASR